jgi:putative membrane protein
MNRDVRRVLSDADLDAITAAVASAETGTAGEIAVVIVPHSRSWRTDGWLQAAVLGLLAGLAYLLSARYGNWGTFYPFARATIVGAATFGVALVFFAYWSHRPAQLVRECWRNALRHFGALSPTRGRTAVLILLSLAEQRAVIIADRGIAGRVAPDYWHKPQRMIAQALADGRPVEGLVAAIAEIGARLAEHFPRAADDRNELPDRPQLG